MPNLPHPHAHLHLRIHTRTLFLLFSFSFSLSRPPSQRVFLPHPPTFSPTPPCLSPLHSCFLSLSPPHCLLFYLFHQYFHLRCVRIALDIAFFFFIITVPSCCCLSISLLSIALPSSSLFSPALLHLLPHSYPPSLSFLLLWLSPLVHTPSVDQI